MAILPTDALHARLLRGAAQLRMSRPGTLEQGLANECEGAVGAEEGLGVSVAVSAASHVPYWVLLLPVMAHV